VTSADPDPASYRPLPWERWVVASFVRKWSGGGADQRRVRQNYGPDGVALLGAAALYVASGGVVALVGTIGLVATGGSVAAYAVMGIGALIDVVSFPAKPCD
jgi:hypothetical protein